MEHTEELDYLGHTFILSARPTADGKRWEGFFSTRIPADGGQQNHTKKIRGNTATPEEALKLAGLGARYFLETLE